jgi:hypothetical protein
MLAAWRALAPVTEGLERAVAAALARGDGAAQLETHLDQQPAQDALLAWLWSQWNTPTAPRRVAEICRRARIREVGHRLRAEGVAAVWLWGAGDHTRRLLESPRDLGMPVIGLVDDSAVGRQQHGFIVAPPSRLRPGDHALISSDWHEDAIWAAAAQHRARGVKVHRLYGGDGTQG